MTLFHFENTYSSLPEIFFQRINPEIPKNPKLIKFNQELAVELKLKIPQNQTELLAILSGQTLDAGSEPIALAYAGHQFGYFNPQLGDGRAVLLGEHVTGNKRLDIQLKGSGQTRFSRQGDGKSAIGPALREYLISEALYYLKIPTTRTLAVIETGETVLRERPLPGGLSVRVASSHIRIGSFEYFAARSDWQSVQQLADYAIYRHYPELYKEYVKNKSERYLAFLKKVVNRQALLIAHWMSVGFIHGVMNTDNTLISGESIDFGPCAFIDTYHPDAVFSSIDNYGRYAYSNQPPVMRWNLACLAQCLVPLLHKHQNQAIDLALAAIEEFTVLYEKFRIEFFSQKLGFKNSSDSQKSLIQDFLNILTAQKFDFTNSFRNLKYLIDVKKIEPEQLKNRPRLQKYLDFFNNSPIGSAWKTLWLKDLELQNISINHIIYNIDSKNPFLIPRNHSVELAITEATYHQNYESFLKWTEVIKQPFIENELNQNFATSPECPDPHYQTFCGT